MDKKGNKRYKKPEDKLEDILIYHKRKYIMPICLILYLALVLVSIVLTLGVAAYAGEEPPGVAKEILSGNETSDLPRYPHTISSVRTICGIPKRYPS